MLSRGHRSAVFCLLAPFCLAPALAAELDARSYLDRMSHSLRELDYQGVLTYEYGSRIATFRLLHAVRNGEEFERLIQLDGNMREVVRDSHALVCVHPGHQLLRLGPQAAAASASGRNGPSVRRDLARHYDIDFGEAARVAGRPAVVVRVSPRDAYRHGFRFYLDRPSALLLKRLTVDSAGRVLERFQFAQLDIGPVDDADLAFSQDARRVQHHLPRTGQSGLDGEAAGWPRPQWLPPGFTLSTARLEERQGGSAYLSMYTDGLSTLTLVVEDLSGGAELPVDGRAGWGTTVAYVRQVTVEERPLLVTVVGEVPLLTARKVASSLPARGGN